MSSLLTPLLHLQRLFIPALLALLAWAVWRLVRRKDLAVGLALYLGLVIVVDGFYNTGIYLPGVPIGSIRYSAICALFLLMYRPPAAIRQRPVQDAFDLPPNKWESVAGAVAWLVPHRVTHLVGFYFALLFVSALRSPMSAGIFEFRMIVIPQIVAFLVTKRGFGSRDEYRRFFMAFTALVLVIGLFVFWDAFFDRWLLKSNSLLSGDYSVPRQQGRFGGLFINPNYLGAFVVLVFPTAFVCAFNQLRFWPRLYAMTGLMALVFCLVETQSRGPLLAFGIAIAVLVIGPIKGLSRSRRLAHLAMFLAIFVVFMPGFYEHSMKRFASIDEETSTDSRSRQSVWNYTAKIIADHPVRGIGFGEQRFVAAMNAYGFKEQYNEQSLDNPHNSYLQMAVYAGIPALAAFLLANVVLIAKAVRVCVRGITNERYVYGLAVGITGFLFSIYPDMHMFTVTVAPVYWVFFALLLALTRDTTVHDVKAEPGAKQQNGIQGRASGSLNTPLAD